MLFFLWIPGAEFSRERVRERVEHGGHDIPDKAIYRRYPRTIRNLFDLYSPLCDQLFFYDNSGSAPELIFEQDNSGRRVVNSMLYKEILEEHQL